ELGGQIDRFFHTSDPNTIEVYYKSVLPVSNTYIQQKVLLEMGARSLTEPAEIKSIISFIDENYKDLPFTQSTFDVQVVMPTRTFIEKVLLLHEKFSKPFDKIRTDRLTRHFYDLDKMMSAGYGEKAIIDNELFETIVEHRKTVNLIRGLDYSNHEKGKLSIIPPNEVISKWKEDYKIMQQNMIVGTSLNWDALIKNIRAIENKFNRL
ncbi:MAG: nucleotidyl transferase AbiEii/AbiGii toxin family protein, partial [Flavobacterium sp.]|nr:nucleotidyl transferase AbiEii/AbiGii toxin family protein [Candidatus Neoflavobacterium equi]